jgi:hypothetical protein
MSEHTPIPWRVEDRRHAPLKNIRIVAGCEEICQVYPVHQRDDQGGFKGNKESHEAADAIDAVGLANAAFIVEACNSHAALVAALQEAREMVAGWAEYADKYFQEKHDLKGDLARLDAALAGRDG